MRPLAVAAVSLTLGIGISVAAVAVLHGVEGPRTETVAEATAVAVPGPFAVDPGPLDRVARRIDFDETVDATHGRRVELTGTLGAGGAGLRVLVLGEGGRGPLVHRVRPDAQGRFEVELRAGRYELRVLTAAGAAARDARRLDLAADTEVDLTETRARYELRLVAGGRPLAKGLVSLSHGGRVLATAVSDAEGRVTVDAPPGVATWEVWASGPGWPRGGARWTGEVTLGKDAGPLSIEVDDR